ncbi:hypothetical protein [Psychrobacillus sp. MER TA 171]|uniref:hypothetical protein n=1 Tax=Psychrobacillus sp. MER TA 171 TaxID=2939577 RepID=UPI00203EEFC1|nr:hypothetical protein [Psychrobacillus sp. MER TA 171]MCM3358676.1 hypothetical protein [Psychrobacillus sp. MER TA 171]
MGGKGSGRKLGSKMKKVIIIKGAPSTICIGPICNRKYTPLSEFGINKSYCLKCRKLLETTKRESNFVEYKYQEAIRHAKVREKKGKLCEIAPNLKNLIETMRIEQKYCYYSGVKLMEKVNDPNSWSIDRVYYHAGYVADNMVLCATSINIVKGSIESALDKAKKTLIPLYGEEKSLTIIKKILEII